MSLAQPLLVGQNVANGRRQIVVRDNVDPPGRRDKNLGPVNLVIATWTLIAFVAAVTIMGTLITLSSHGGALRPVATQAAD